MQKGQMMELSESSVMKLAILVGIVVFFFVGRH